MEEKNENVVEETTQDTVEQTVEKVEEPKKEEKPKTPKNEDGDYKVNLSNIKNEENGIREEVSSNEKSEEKQKEEKEEVILEDVTNEKPEPAKEAKEEVSKETELKEQTPGMELPENIEKLVEFMNETGGTVEDYVKLNTDYSSLEDSTLLKEYYQKTKPHLNQEELDFLIEDSFSYDEDEDGEKDVKRKKLAYKEAVAEAKQHLEGLKGKYYEELKLGSKLPPQQQKAIDFFDRYNKEQEQAKELQQQAKTVFNNETDKVFNENFKGFDFQVGDKKYRYNVKDMQAVRSDQSEFSSWLKPYIDDNYQLKNAKDYHKTLFAGKNADAIANHFYEQGKADGIKNLTSQAKNINMDARKTDNGTVDLGGIKVKAISGDDSSKLKFKLKNY